MYYIHPDGNVLVVEHVPGNWDVLRVVDCPEVKVPNDASRLFAVDPEDNRYLSKRPDGRWDYKVPGYPPKVL